MKCGTCTLCCTLCVVPELDKSAGTACKFQGDGYCTDYDNRPKSCRDMECAWLQSGAHEELRPDKCGVFWERVGNTMYGSRDPSRTEYPHLKEQIQAFLSQGAQVKLTGGLNGSCKL